MRDPRDVVRRSEPAPCRVKLEIGGKPSGWTSAVTRTCDCEAFLRIRRRRVRGTDGFAHAPRPVSRRICAARVGSRPSARRLLADERRIQAGETYIRLNSSQRSHPRGSLNTGTHILGIPEILMGALVVILILAVTLIAQPPNRWVKYFSKEKDTDSSR